MSYISNTRRVSNRNGIFLLWPNSQRKCHSPSCKINTKLYMTEQNRNYRFWKLQQLTSFFQHFTALYLLFKLVEKSTGNAILPFQGQERLCKTWWRLFPFTNNFHLLKKFHHPAKKWETPEKCFHLRQHNEIYNC